MSAAAYCGLAVVGIVGSPLIVTAVLIGGVPYGVYRVVKKRRERVRGRFAVGNEMLTVERTIRSPARVLQPDEMVGQEDEEFDSESTRLTALSELIAEAETRGARSGTTGVLEGVHVVEGEVKNRGEEEEPSASIEECRVGKPFVLERRRGSVTGNRVARRTML